MTSTATIIAEVVTNDGDAMWDTLGRREYQSTPPAVFDTHQRGELPVTIQHGGPLVGHVDYLETGLGYGNGGLYAVAVVEGIAAELLDEQVFCSAELRTTAPLSIETITPRPWSRPLERRTRQLGTMTPDRAELEGLALVDSTAGLTSTRVRAFDGDYRDRIDLGRMRAAARGSLPSIIERAADAATYELRYRRPASTVIHRAQPDDLKAEYTRSGWRPEVRHSAPHFGVLGVR